MFQTNSLGFRHPEEIEALKPRNTFRIFVLGDSFTEGAAPGLTVSDWVSKRLKRDYPKINFEVINAGVASQSLIPYIIRLRHQILTLSPDLIVVNIDKSDVRDDLHLVPVTELDSEGIPLKVSQSYQKYRFFRSWLNSPASRNWYFIGRYLYTAKILWNKFFHIQEYALEKTMRKIDHGDPKRNEILSDYVWILKKDLSEAEKGLFREWPIWIDVLAAVCKKHRTPLILSTYPHPIQYTPEGGRNLRQTLLSRTKALGVPFFDAYEPLRPYAQDIYLPNDVHFNAFGTRKWGEVLGEFISTQVSEILGSEDLDEKK